MLYFGDGCAAEADRPALAAFLESDAYEAELEGAVKRAGARHSESLGAAAAACCV